MAEKTVAVSPLPASDSNAGAMARLFIVEAMSPGLPGYDATENLMAMRLMRQVIENRLKNPRLYGARSAKTETDIIMMGNQYAGFGAYPVLPANMTRNLATILKWAADPKWPTQAKYARFVNDAIQAATESIATPVVTYWQVTAWRTQGSSSPGKNFVMVGSWSGNTFYSTKLPTPSQRQHHQRRQR